MATPQLKLLNTPLARCALAMALAAPTTAATIAATLWIVRSASSSKQAQSWAPAGVDSTVSVIDCAVGLVPSSIDKGAVEAWNRRGPVSH